MERIISTPHLPEGEVRYLIIGGKYKKVLEKPLNQLKIGIICVNDNAFVDERLSGHADLSVLHRGNNIISALEYLKDCELDNKLRALGFAVDYINNPTDKNYPHDVRLNICILCDSVICNKNTADISLINDKHIIDCKQGYTKCSVAVIDDNSIITSDRIIAENAAAHGIESLLIDDSFVKLNGFDKGFIGGATFKISRDKIAFTGTIDSIEEKNAIEKFLSKRGIQAIYLLNEPIFDIGGAIPIIEEI